MALCITITKLEESSLFADYTFADPETEVGVLRLNKSTGDVDLLQAASNDTSGIRFRSAATKLMLHWRDGEFPDKTFWAS